MLTAAIGGVMIGVGGKMLFDKAAVALAKAILKKKLDKDAEAVVEATAEVVEATEETINEDEVE
jgi:hypothetical protein